ncbi:hypothetical protein RBU61_17260 [Tissierella sp. MB52-C2]|uniref:hypothetical protein n=1 Tax=Tissierella sp. MB52-C2 TaxID=3070999 RepID=UPI00280B8D9E|nr:hypothetical protein [Tissierella sp. MB52-C2]WMM24654.1 hypothetical protein RBU61_17260 [Tissierella sp. MB52-C2]
MKSLNDIIWNEDLDLEEENGNIQLGEYPSLEQSCGINNNCGCGSYNPYTLCN